MTTSADIADAFVIAIAPWVAIFHNASWAGVLAQLLLAGLGVMLFHMLGTRVLERVARPFPFSRRLVAYGHRAGAMALFLMASQLILRNADQRLAGILTLQHACALAVIAAFTWLIVRCVKAIGDTIVELNPAHAADNLQARRIQTQTRVLTRAVMTLLVVIGSGLALMTIPVLRQIGGSLLASAGVAGLVIGFAARPVLTNLLAGIQLALTQPIRLDDVVIVQNEWGWIEEITGTYVVVRIWDQRRLILPLQWFIENPFQNWTRTTAEILGTVSLWLDYRTPVEAIRKEAERLCEAAPEWDRRLCQTQVVDASDRAIHVRILISAGDAGRAWDLRCRIREGLVDFIQREYPDCLPRLRMEADGLPGRDGTGTPGVRAG